MFSSCQKKALLPPILAGTGASCRRDSLAVTSDTIRLFRQGDAGIVLTREQGDEHGRQAESIVAEARDRRSRARLRAAAQSGLVLPRRLHVPPRRHEASPCHPRAPAAG